jgi:octopine/nopaline transport system ATP-binding protein
MLAFASDYTLARAHFLDAAKAAGAQLTVYEHPQQGPSGEPLFTDVAWLGSSNAKSVFVVVSGTHGVEGIGGSGAQTAWLQ